MLAASLVLLTVALAQADSLLPVLKVGETIQGEIPPDAPIVESPGLAEGINHAPARGITYRLELDGGGPVTITLKSIWFDSFLVARDADGILIAEDDDGWYGTHSRLCLASGKDVVTIDAVAIRSHFGKFELEVGVGQVKPPDAEAADAWLAQEARTVLSLKSEVGDPSQLAAYAWLLRARGAYEDSRTLLERALAIDERTLGPEHPYTANSVSDLAGLLMDQGAYEDARPLMERALANDEKMRGPEHPNTASSLYNLGTLVAYQGAYDAARPLLERALAIYEARLGPEHPNTASCLNSLALLLMDQGAYEDARPLMERALAIDEERLGPEHPATAASLHSLAALLRCQGAYEDARPLLERAIAIREKALGPEHRTTATCLNSLALLLTNQGAYEAARPLLERVLAIFEKTLGPEHPDTAVVLNNLAGLLNRQGAYEDAMPLSERALAICEKTLGPEHPDTVASMTQLALSHLDLSRLAEAKALAHRAMTSVGWHVSRESTGLSAGGRMQFLGQLFEHLEFLLSTTRSSPGDVRAVADAVLSWKGQAHRAAKGLARERGSLGEEAESSIRRVRSLSSQLSTRAYATQVPDREVHDIDLTRLRRELNRAEEELNRLLQRDLGWRPVGSGSVIAALPAGSVLVDVLVHGIRLPARVEGSEVVQRGRWLEGQVTAFVYRPSEPLPTRVELGPAGEIARGVEAYLDSLGARRGVPVAVVTEDTGATLRRLLWEPLVQHVGDATHVLISPDGALGTLPWGVLPDGNGGYLVEEHRFSYLPDVGAVVRMGMRMDGDLGRGALAAGGLDYFRRGDLPDLSAVSLAELRGPADGSFQQIWPSLLATRDEATLVADLFAMKEDAPEEAFLLTGAAATEEALKTHMEGRRFVHLATHGYFQPKGLPSMWENIRKEGREEWHMRETPRAVTGLVPGLLSGLVCAGANKIVDDVSRDNGLLTASEVGWLDLTGCELVVLSACETALGEQRSGEGMISLQRAFHTAGALSVVSSLWKVPDDATADLMRNFYTRLWVRGEPKGEALRGAQLDMIKKNRIESGDARPATWGAFVLSGDWW